MNCISIKLLNVHFKKNYRDIKKKPSKLMKRSGNVSKTKIHKIIRKTLGKYAKKKAVGIERT